MNTDNLALDLGRISSYLAEFPRENIYALSYLAEASLSPGMYAYLYRSRGNIEGVQIALADGRWFPFFTDKSAVPQMAQQIFPHHPRWIGAMQSIADPLLCELSNMRPIRIKYREDDYACELDPSLFCPTAASTTKKATMADLYAVAELRRAFEAEYFGTSPHLLRGNWAVRLAARYIEQGTWLGLTAGAIVSMAVTEARIPGYAHVGAIYTSPEQRGKGMAGSTVSAYCSERLDMGDRITLHVKKDNTTALQLYQSLGFQPWGSYVMCSFK